MMRPYVSASALLLLAHSAIAGAQTLTERIRSMGDGAVTFHFAARPGVCGDGLHFIRMGQSYMGSMSSEYRSERCEFGPVQVRVAKRDGNIERVESWVGILRDRDARDLGVVSTKDAAAALLQIARTADGGASTKAILPAVLADSTTIWPTLVIIARDTATRSHSTRQDAMFWLSRLAASAAAGRPNDIIDEREAKDGEELKSHAVFVLSQLPKRDAVPALLEVARSNKDVAVRGKALFWLSQTGDTRAVDLFESLLR